MFLYRLRRHHLTNAVVPGSMAERRARLIWRECGQVASF